MSIIRKKCWPEYFEKVKSGEKKFEVRLADFDCEIGDTLILEEWNPEIKKYTGRELSMKITYLLNIKDLEFYQKSDIEKYGLRIMSLAEMSEENDEWFASVKACPHCEGTKFLRKKDLVSESLRCLGCGEIIAASNDV